MSKSHRKPPPAQPKPPAQRSYLDLAIGLGLILAIFLVYAQVGSFDFTTYDDDLYVSDNVHVQEGVTLSSIKWAFTAVVSSNWMPVTLLSHILDGQLFHMQAGMHHLMNVVFHALATLLLFAALRRATGARAASAFVALLFAVHPLHVGSVAWISERKDVLSAFFFFLTLYAYVRYVEQPSRRLYLLMTATFCLGLLAKPMLVTFPFVLLLFDVWPLRRVQQVPFLKLVREKIPLFALVAAVSAVTYLVQRSTGAVLEIPLVTRIQNAFISYVVYFGQTFWPSHLSVIYPYAQSISAVEAAVALALLLAVSALAVRLWRTHPYFAVGWFWYLGTLVPVIGLVQVGLQSHADRYTYLPMVGLSMILAWGAMDVLKKWPRAEPAIAAAAVIAGVACMAISWTQAAYWRNSETLFQHAVDVTDNNWMAQYNLGHYLMSLPGRIPDAIPHFQAALRIKPDYAEAHNNLGASLMNTGHIADAIPQFEAALRIKPDFADAHFNLGLTLTKTPGRNSEALAQYQEALRLNPDHEAAHTNLAVLLVNLGRTPEAISHFEAAVRLNPSYENEHNLGAMLTTISGRQSEAIAHLEAAQRIHPDPETSKIIDRLRAGQ